MKNELFETLFPKTSRNTRNRISLRHERKISRGVAQHISLFITDDEATTMTFKEMVSAAKERSGFSSPNHPVPTRGYDTYFYANPLLEPQFEGESSLRCEAGEAWQKLLDYRAPGRIKILL